jgi:hypothetical protein
MSHAQDFRPFIQADYRSYSPLPEEDFTERAARSRTELAAQNNTALAAVTIPSAARTSSSGVPMCESDRRAVGGSDLASTNPSAYSHGRESRYGLDATQSQWSSGAENLRDPETPRPALELQAARDEIKKLLMSIATLESRNECLNAELRRQVHSPAVSDPIVTSDELMSTLQERSLELREKGQESALIGRLVAALEEFLRLWPVLSDLDPAEPATLCRIDQAIYTPPPCRDAMELDESPLFDLVLQTRLSFENAQRLARFELRDRLGFGLIKVVPDVTPFSVDFFRLAESSPPVPTPRRELHNIVAAVVRHGYVQRDEVLQKAVVVCYRALDQATQQSRF